MDFILLLKILVTPAIVLGASIAGRIWGQSIAGWLVALPLTSGPIAFFLALDLGTAFVEATAFGVVSGAAAQGGFCVGYAAAAKRGAPWSVSLPIGLASYALIASILRFATPPFWALVAIAVACLTVSIILMPPRRIVSHRDFVHPRWDLPARVLIATALVVGLTAAAPFTGPWLSGVLATVPVFGSIMVAFAHRHYGVDAALHVLRGFLLGIFSVVGFFFALAHTIAPLGIALSFAVAIIAALATQALTLWLMPSPKPNTETRA